jgi:ABC-2 type transport system permease protein
MMKDICASLVVEAVKVWRSMIFRVTIAATCFVSAMLGLMMYLVRNPEILPPGILKTKVAIAAIGSDWPAYLGFSEMAAGAIGIILYGFIFSWIFGREYGDRTVKDVLSLPVSRASIVISKLMAATVWSGLLGCLMFALAIAFGVLLGLPGWSDGLFGEYARIFFGSTLLSIMPGSPAAFVASAARGVLPAIGFMLACLGLANFFGNIGLGQYFPWTIPMLYTGAVGSSGTQLPLVSYGILWITCIGGIAGTIVFWMYADQDR